MDGNKIMKGLIQGLIAVGILLGAYVGFAISMYIVAIVFGILFQVGETLGLDNTTVEFLGNISDNWYTFATNLLTGANLVGTLVQVAIVIVVFGAFIYIGYKGYQKLGKKGRGDSSY